MSVEFYYLANVIVASRLICIFNDQPVTRRQSVVVGLLQWIGLGLFELNAALVVLAVLLAFTNFLVHFFENRSKKVNEPRLLVLPVYLILLSIFFSPEIGLRFNPDLAAGIGSLAGYSLLLSESLNVDWLRFQITLLGFLLVTNEVNLLIRYLLSIINLEPKKELRADKRLITVVDQRGYNAGRLIGILERGLVYYFVLNAQFAAIGFILAAKSFTRFKELEQREYAEYVLIGTLLSMSLAILVALLTQMLLP